jgi:hypothetical protein
MLAVINAPFDWFSLGITRALLRRGVELKGWWPYALGFLDFALAFVLLFLLVAAMVVGVQAFDYLAGLSGEAPILPLAPLFKSIATHPAAPEHWWVYATLFSTLLPSAFNLVMGAWSLTRGLPFLSTLCAARMPEGAATPVYDRVWIAAVLTGQWLVGFALTIATLCILGWVIWIFFPSFGFAFLHWAEFIASLEIPRQSNEWVLRFVGR